MIVATWESLVTWTEMVVKARFGEDFQRVGNEEFEIAIKYSFFEQFCYKR